MLTFKVQFLGYTDLQSPTENFQIFISYWQKESIFIEILKL